MTKKDIEEFRKSVYTECGITFNKVNHDIYGNPRYVVHFYSFLTKSEKNNRDLDINQKYLRAKNRAHKLGFSVYRANWYGGGFIGQSYNLHETAKNILDITK